MISSFLLFLLILFFCAFIGWITNWLAIKMIFRPYERIRIIGPLGWQGILARHADRFARDVADMITQELLSPRDLAVQIDPALIGDTLEPLLVPAIDAAFQRFVDTLPASLQRSPLLNVEVFDEVKMQLLDEVQRLTPELRDLVVARIDALVDLHGEIIKNLTGGNVGRLEDLILTVVGKEFRWIEYYGGIFGAFFGMLQIGLRPLGFTTAWIIPLVGIVVGLATNWIAIQMIFAPRHPVRLGPVTLQGVFPRRQREIALSLAQVIARELTFSQILDVMMASGFADELRAFAARRLAQFLTPRLEMLQTILASEGVTASIERIAEDTLDEIAPRLPGVLAAIKQLTESQVDVLAQVRVKLEDMDKLRFENVLRALVQEDEGILVAYGGVLGGVIGLAQMGLLATLW